ncbi:hypothetical protein CCH79_00010696 [Gambusia affinis]|uniref:Uncharacterized protein n=1 Tax=Gambusia affinis TaxID=33528 RepID=A0A315W7T9_GAMAF|nr:hypothetical protein CCH79_00010696 [Gambusia affinis]
MIHCTSKHNFSSVDALRLRPLPSPFLHALTSMITCQPLRFAEKFDSIQGACTELQGQKEADKFY